DRKPARETTDPGTHGPLSCLTTGPPMTKQIAREMDGSETPLCETLIPVGKCGQGQFHQHLLNSPKSALFGQCLERGLRSRAEVLNNLGGCKRTKPRRNAVVVATRKPDHEARRKQVASAGRVDNTLNRQRMDRIGLL